MRRYVGFGIVLIAALAIGGCSNAEPETPPLADQAPPANTPEPAAADEPSGAEAPIADTQSAERSPTVLGAIGRAVAGAVGVSENEEPSEAPAYRPPQ